MLEGEGVELGDASRCTLLSALSQSRTPWRPAENKNKASWSKDLTLPSPRNPPVGVERAGVCSAQTKSEAQNEGENRFQRGAVRSAGVQPARACPRVFFRAGWTPALPFAVANRQHAGTAHVGRCCI